MTLAVTVQVQIKFRHKLRFRLKPWLKGDAAG